MASHDATSKAMKETLRHQKVSEECSTIPLIASSTIWMCDIIYLFYCCLQSSELSCEVMALQFLFQGIPQFSTGIVLCVRVFAMVVFMCVCSVLYCIYHCIAMYGMVRYV